MSVKPDKSVGGPAAAKLAKTGGRTGLAKPGGRAETALATTASLKKLWDAIGRRKTLMGLTLFVGLLDMLVDSLGLSWSLRMTGNAVLTGDLGAVYPAVRFLVLVVVCRASFAALGHYLAEQVTEQTALNLRSRLFRAILGGKSERLDALESGDLISRLGNDVEVAKSGVRAFVNGSKQIFLILAALTGLLVWSWPFAVGLLVMAGVSFLGGAATSSPLRRTSQRYQRTLAGVSESATNLLGGVAVIKSLRAEDKMASRFKMAVDQHQEAARRRGFYMALQSGAVMSVPYIGLGIMMILAGAMSLRGLFAAGDAIGLVQLSSRALFPFGSLGGIWAELQQNLAALDRVLEACAIPQEGEGSAADGLDAASLAGAGLGAAGPTAAGSDDAAGAKVLHGDSCEAPAVEFRDVHFGYGAKPVLEGLCFEVRQGDQVALVGPSGSGKSTVFRLLLGMYEPQVGVILVGGRDSAQMSLPEIRSVMAVLPQEPWLSPGTVKDNILLGRPDATDEEVAMAAELAHAAGFIAELPDGYDSVLDGNLSGGQRQRICLARAFLKDAPILLLDEPTSAVDAESERLIRQSVDLLGKGRTVGRTVITVAHTQAMVERADITVTLG